MLDPKTALTCAVLALANAGCSKKEEAAKAPEPPVQNAVTQHVGELQQDVKKAQGAQAAANAAIQRTDQAVGEATGDGSAEP